MKELIMKKLFILGLACCLLAGAAGAAEQIAFVDLERLFNEFYKTQLAKSKMDVQKNDIEAERQIMISEMTQISEEVDVLKKEARDITLSQEIRDEKRILFEERVLELRDKQKEIEAYVARRQQQIQAQVTRMSQSIMDEIRQVVVEYAQQAGLQAVIDRSQRQAAVGVFVYVRPDIDISQEILIMLNSKRPDIIGDAAATESIREDEQEEEVEEQ